MSIYVPQAVEGENVKFGEYNPQQEQIRRLREIQSRFTILDKILPLVDILSQYVKDYLKVDIAGNWYPTPKFIELPIEDRILLQLMTIYVGSHLGAFTTPLAELDQLYIAGLSPHNPGTNTVGEILTKLSVKGLVRKITNTAAGRLQFVITPQGLVYIADKIIAKTSTGGREILDNFKKLCQVLLEDMADGE